MAAQGTVAVDNERESSPWRRRATAIVIALLAIGGAFYWFSN